MTKYICRYDIQNTTDSVCVCVFIVFFPIIIIITTIFSILSKRDLVRKLFLPSPHREVPYENCSFTCNGGIFFISISILASVRAITIYVCIHTYTRYRLISIGIWEKRARQVLYRFVSWYFWDIREQLFGQNKKHLLIHTYIYHICAVIHDGNITHMYLINPHAKSYVCICLLYVALAVQNST